MRLWAACLLGIAAGASAKTSVTRFKNEPQQIHYFEDSSAVLYHDAVARELFFSPDEGQTFHEADGIPAGEAALLVPHPYDKSRAYVLSRGTTHWRTNDRGRSWQTIETPAAPLWAMSGDAPLLFHAKNWDWTIFMGRRCVLRGFFESCEGEAFVTRDAFASPATRIAQGASRCIFAHERPEMLDGVPNELMLCTGLAPAPASAQPRQQPHASAPYLEQHLFASTTFFETYETIRLSRNQQDSVMGVGTLGKFIVAAMKPVVHGSSQSASSEMALYVSLNAETWKRAEFPHGHELQENAYTLLEATSPNSLLVDIASESAGHAPFGSLFKSSQDGTKFVRVANSTSRSTTRGLVDFEKVFGISGIAIINVVANRNGVLRGEPKRLQTLATFDDGGSFVPLVDEHNKPLHLHSVNSPHHTGRVFSSAAPGILMAVGSTGDFLAHYDDSDTFLSTDAGLSWTRVLTGAHKYKVGDQGNILIAVDDESYTDVAKYSLDWGITWKTAPLGVSIRPSHILTAPDATLTSFLIIGTATRADDKPNKVAVVAIDFADELPKCSDKQLELWHARASRNNHVKECVMGSAQGYMRRKRGAKCLVKRPFTEPVSTQTSCPCTDADFECDFGFERLFPGSLECIPVSAIHAPPNGACTGASTTFDASSGYRRIPGNTCDSSRGISKDRLVQKSCAEIKAPVVETEFILPGEIHAFSYLKNSRSIFALLKNRLLYYSVNEGASWSPFLKQFHTDDDAPLIFHVHPTRPNTVYVIGDNSQTVYYSVDGGVSWRSFKAPALPNRIGVFGEDSLLEFHPIFHDYLIWIGQENCDPPNAPAQSPTCHRTAFLSTNHGARWTVLDTYVKTCKFTKTDWIAPDDIIMCAVAEQKSGDQRSFQPGKDLYNLVRGESLNRRRTIMLDHIVGFSIIDNFVVAGRKDGNHIAFHVSENAFDMAATRLPSTLSTDGHGITTLQSNTHSVYLYVSSDSLPGREFGTLLKSNSNGTYYTFSLDYVNANQLGFTDFEQLAVMDGVAIANVVSNPRELERNPLQGKLIQSRISHSDGAHWSLIPPPPANSKGSRYAACDSEPANCFLHLHGYTGRRDIRAMYGSPAYGATGIVWGVGSVGPALQSYEHSSTFMSHDAGFSWSEIDPEPSLFEIGDKGSILVKVRDDETDYVEYSTDLGASWNAHKLKNPLRAVYLTNAPSDTSRRFVLFGRDIDSNSYHAVSLNFEGVAPAQCKLIENDPDRSDFEAWSPRDQANEKCLFGRINTFYRKKPDRMCHIGNINLEPKVQTCECTHADFECEYNHIRDPETKECVLAPGVQPRPNDDFCAIGQPFWYERTAYHRVPYTKCSGGLQLNLGRRHACPAYRRHSLFYWFFFLLLPIGVAATLAYAWINNVHPSYFASLAHSTLSTGAGAIRLPEWDDAPSSLSGLGGFASGILSSIRERFEHYRAQHLAGSLRGRHMGYEHISTDDDAELLNGFEDDDD